MIYIVITIGIILMLVYINGAWCNNSTPFPPSNLTWILEKLPNDTGKITVRWKLSESKDIQYQQVRVAKDRKFLSLPNNGKVARNISGYYILGVKPGQAFYFEVYAVNNAGIRSASAIINIYIPDFPDTDPPKPVTKLTHKIEIVS